MTFYSNIYFLTSTKEKLCSYTNNEMKTRTKETKHIYAIPRSDTSPTRKNSSRGINLYGNRSFSFFLEFLDHSFFLVWQPFVCLLVWSKFDIYFTELMLFAILSFESFIDFLKGRRCCLFVSHCFFNIATAIVEKPLFGIDSI